MPWLRKERSPKRRNRSSDHGTEAKVEVQFEIHPGSYERESGAASNQQERLLLRNNERRQRHEE